MNIEMMTRNLQWSDWSMEDDNLVNVKIYVRQIEKTILLRSIHRVMSMKMNLEKRKRQSKYIQETKSIENKR